MQRNIIIALALGYLFFASQSKAMIELFTSDELIGSSTMTAQNNQLFYSVPKDNNQSIEIYLEYAEEENTFMKILILKFNSLIQNIDYFTGELIVTANESYILFLPKNLRSLLPHEYTQVVPTLDYFYQKNGGDKLEIEQGLVGHQAGLEISIEFAGI